MKTKLLLGALALPMFFAACTNEELIEAPVNANLQNRIPLGDVTLDFGSVNSRLALEDGTFNTFDWTDGDDLGASLIDVVGTLDSNAETEAEIIQQYNLTKTPQTNYRYEYNGGTWASNAAMVEGNYVFYMPYIENTNRTAPLAVLPTVQNLEQVAVNGEAAYTTYNDVLENAKANGNIMAVAYKFLSAAGENNDGNKSISVSFKQLYATPLISIQNYARDNENKLTDLTVNKIVLSLSENSEFTVKGYLNFTATADCDATREAWTGNDNSIVNCLNTVLNPADANYKGGSWVNTSGAGNVVERSTAQLLSDYSDANNTQKSKTITINVEEPITIASEETFSFYAVIPGGDYTRTKINVALYTTEGKTVDVTLPGVKINPGKRYAVGGYDEEGNVDAGATALLAVTTKQLVDAPVEVETATAIATQAELYAAVATAQMVDSNNDGILDEKAKLEFIPAEGVVLNDQVISMLEDKKDEIESVLFKGNMAVDGLTTTTDVLVEIQGNATLEGVVKAELASENTEKKLFVTGQITVAEDAEVELEGTANAGITNNGTLTIVGDASAGNHMINNSVLNLKANLTLSGKNLTNAAGAEINSVIASKLAASKVINNGTIAVTSANLTVASAVDNYGIINSAKSLTIEEAVINKENAELNVTNGEAEFGGGFTNEGAATIAEGATLTASESGSINKNKIDNAGTLNIDMNIGTINVTNSSKFGTSSTTVKNRYVDGDGKAVWGNIYNPYAKTIGDDAMNGGAGQYVWNSSEACTSDVDWVESDGTFNAVKYDGATVAAGGNETTKLIYIEFNGYSKLIVTGALALPVAVQVNAEELEIAGEGSTLSWAGNAILTVAGDAVVGWNDNIDFGTVTIQNEGKVYGNAGTLSGITKNGTGTYIGFD